MSTDLLLVAGARPNFVKLAPLYHALGEQSSLNFKIVHTGQHYDHELSQAFFDDLGIPEPDVNLEVGSGSHAEQTGAIMTRFEPVVNDLRPKWIAVFGDVNSTVACALTAAKLGVKVAHVEAGLRSHDWTMPEEINRVVTDRLSDRLYTPSRDACDNLKAEGITQDRIKFVGNIMVDTLRRQLPRVDRKRVLKEYQLRPQGYVLVTLHRPSNVDDGDTLLRVCHLLGEAAKREPVVFPAHPRTASRIEEPTARSALGATRVVPPLPYPTFLGLMAEARVVVTDSGGVQEETTALGVPCLTLRENTERPITISEGTNRLVGVEPTEFANALQSANTRRNRVPELWDGRTADRIAADLSNLVTAADREVAPVR